MFPQLIINGYTVTFSLSVKLYAWFQLKIVYSLEIF